MPLLRVKTIIQAMRTLPPLALNAEPARCATGYPGKHTHTQGIPWRVEVMGRDICPVTGKSTQGHSPLAPVPRSLQKADEGLSRLEDSLLNSKSCSQTSWEARGQRAPYPPRPMGDVETQEENP